MDEIAVLNRTERTKLLVRTQWKAGYISYECSCVIGAVVRRTKICVPSTVSFTLHSMKRVRPSTYLHRMTNGAVVCSMLVWYVAHKQTVAPDVEAQIQETSSSWKGRRPAPIVRYGAETLSAIEQAMTDYATG